MTLTPSRIPKVPVRPRRKLGPPPDPDAPVTLPPALDALLKHRHNERMRRAELYSLHPDYLNRIRRQLETERAAEEQLQRGRAQTRWEIRQMTDLGRMGLDRHRVRFPRLGCTICEIFRPIIWAFGILSAPFALYFGLAFLILL